MAQYYSCRILIDQERRAEREMTYACSDEFYLEYLTEMRT